MGLLHSKEKIDQKFIQKVSSNGIIKIELPTTKLIEATIPSADAYDIIMDELMNEGNARLNLATFCQTKMEDEAIKLIASTLDKNAIDKSEYPKTTEIENRCVAILANLWNHDGETNFIGTSTIGSSEACMLGGLALKFKWRRNIAKLEKSGVLKREVRKPNLVISSALQVCWEKFAVYFDVELRRVPLTEKSLSLDPATVLNYCDENTIGIVGILGITYTGKFDNIEKLNEVINIYNTKYKGQRPPLYMHVDGASGGLFVPFVDEKLIWDFKLNNVVSISASGHKYGLVYPGVGWVVWKDEDFVDSELIFKVSYLGGELPTMAINFSKSGSQMIAQYYQFLRLGKSGFRDIHLNSQRLALTITNYLKNSGIFKILNDGENLPVVCWTLTKIDKNWTLYDLSDILLKKGWQIPTYPLPHALEDIIIQRIVVRADLTMDLVDELIIDFQNGIKKLDEIYHDFKSLTKVNEVKKAVGFTH